MTAPARELQVFECPLEGTQLIEASAGTGKTWNLCGLVLRLLLERDLPVQGILVVTFTHAATAELQTRIRQRLLDVLAVLEGRAVDTGDPFAPVLVDTLRRRGLADATMRQRLQAALASFDEAAIFTIHGFCQRALSDTPFTGHMPLATELATDDDEWTRQAAQDFWRRHVAAASLEPGLAAALLQHKDSPESFMRLLERQLAKPTARALWPRDVDRATPQTEQPALQAAHDTARRLWHHERDAAVQCVLDALPGLKAYAAKPEAVHESALAWDRVLRHADAIEALAEPLSRLDVLGQDRLLKAVRKGQRAPTHAFLAAAQALLERHTAFGRAQALMRLRLLRKLLAEGSRAVRAARRERGIVAFDDMLFNLHERLGRGDAPWLAPALRERFPAALIDEFQDTDPLQFEIFQHLYGGTGLPLFLIGDPKQAIYGFRNADLHTYLGARRQAQAEYTLTANQRSTPALIDALNALFSHQPRAFMLEGLDYREVAAGPRVRTPLVDTTPQPRAPLHVWWLPEDAGHGHRPTRSQAEQAVRRACAGEIARLLREASAQRILLDGRPLRAGDIAVLVRTHAEGAAVRQSLADVGVGSVELSQASVFATPEAEDIERLLRATLEPTRVATLRAALATESMGWDAARLHALRDDDAALLDWQERFAAGRDAWLQRGVGVMLRQWMAREGLTERMLRRPDGARRLTNWLHLVELLHEAAAGHPAPEALLRWLEARRREPGADDAAQLRLESDQNLVQIVTVHKAKGLEYPIVFCPFLWKGGRTGGPAAGLPGAEYHDDDGVAVVDFRSGLDDACDDDDVKQRQRLESAAEDLRLVYVALTRAVHRCVLVAGVYAIPTRGAPSATQSCRSLLNWLVAGGAHTPAQWGSSELTPAQVALAWQALAQRAPHAIAIEPLPTAGAPALAATPTSVALLDAPSAPPIPAGWWTGSYSGLVHGATNEQAAIDHDLRLRPPLQPDPRNAAAADDILGFPRGSQAGSCLHAVFERIDFTRPEGWPAAVQAALQLYGPALAATPPEPEAALAFAPMLTRMLGDVMHTPLPVGTAAPLRLATVPPSRRIVELEFLLPTPALDAGDLQRALPQWGYEVPRLRPATLRGFLKGFIDLVFEHDGRYFVLDWKSNHLGDTAADYAPTRLAQAMAAEGYHLQHLLYAVALERHLQRRLPGYDRAQHFGGVLYLFVRGVRPGWRNADGTPAGLYFHRAEPGVLQALSALLDDGETS